MEKAKSQNQYDPKLSVKPHTHNTMLMTFSGVKGVNTFIVDLADIQTESRKDETIMSINLPRTVIDKEIEGENFILVISDDPTMNHAGDWTQMGCSRFRYVGNKVKEVIEGVNLKFRLKDYRFELLQPERRFPDDIETKFHIW